MPVLFRHASAQFFAMPLLAFVGLLAIAAPSSAPSSQSDQQAQFQNYSSCPSTGKRGGPCPGYRVGYKVGLCAGGQDRWTNMVWLSESAYREQQRRDAAACARSGNRP